MCRAARALKAAHPGLGIKNRFGIPDCPERVHWEEEMARRVGAPGAYDYGPERTSWMTHQLTNWMGDTGFLHKSHCQVRRHNPEGDMLFIKAKVKRKFTEAGKHLVEIEQELQALGLQASEGAAAETIDERAERQQIAAARKAIEAQRGQQARQTEAALAKALELNPRQPEAWDERGTILEVLTPGADLSAITTLTDAENGTPFMARLTQSQVTAQRMGYAQILTSARSKALRGKTVTFRFGRKRLSTSANVRFAVLEWTGTADTVTSDVVPGASPFQAGSTRRAEVVPISTMWSCPKWPRARAVSAWRSAPSESRPWNDTCDQSAW